MFVFPVLQEEGPFAGPGPQTRHFQPDNHLFPECDTPNWGRQGSVTRVVAPL